MKKFFSICFLFIIYQVYFLNFKAQPQDLMCNIKIPRYSYDDTNLLDEIKFTPLEIEIVKKLLKDHKCNGFSQLFPENKEELIIKLNLLDELKFKCILYGCRMKYLPQKYHIRNKNRFLCEISKLSGMLKNNLIYKLSFNKPQKQYVSPLDMEDIYKTHLELKINRNRSDQEIVNDYTGDYYNIMNGILRRNLFVFGNPYVPEDFEGNTCDIQVLSQCFHDSIRLVNILKNRDIGNEIKVLYRGLDELSFKSMMVQKSDELKENQVFVDKAFVSTTTDKRIAEEFAVKNLKEDKNPLILRLDTSKYLPRGMVVYGNKLGDSESEVLLAPGQRFIIEKIRTEEIMFASKSYDVIYVEASLLV